MLFEIIYLLLLGTQSVETSSNRNANATIGVRYQLGLITKYLNDDDPLGMLKLYAPQEFLRSGAAQQVARLKRDFEKKLQGISMTGHDIIYLDLDKLKNYENGDASTDITVCAKIADDVHYRIIWHYFENDQEWRIIDLEYNEEEAVSNQKLAQYLHMDYEL